MSGDGAGDTHTPLQRREVKVSGCERQAKKKEVCPWKCLMTCLTRGCIDQRMASPSAQEEVQRKTVLLVYLCVTDAKSNNGSTVWVVFEASSYFFSAAGALPWIAPPVWSPGCLHLGCVYGMVTFYRDRGLLPPCLMCWALLGSSKGRNSKKEDFVDLVTVIWLLKLSKISWKLGSCNQPSLSTGQTHCTVWVGFFFSPSLLI